MSIARAVLAAEARSRVTLVYGNRREADVIFRDALDALAREHAGRFTLDHVLEDPPDGWAGGSGKLDRPTFESRLDALGTNRPAGIEWYVCGPDPMRAAVREALLERGVDRANLREEVFVRPELHGGEAALPAIDQTLHVRKNGLERTMIVRPGQTLLEAGLAAGMPMPFSCAMGGCAECRCKLVEGSVVMEEPNCLTTEEREQGFVLACVSRPRTTVKLEVPAR
jgi:ferredoxin-NADP reductase